MEYDFFNGDADGMISLHQYRTFIPRHTIKHTGLKRDIDLLRYAANIKDTTLYAFDLSLKTNEQHVWRALGNNNTLVWFDHHTPGDLNNHAHVSAHIDTNPNTCTSWIVDKYLDGLYRPWTIAGAYGDNLHELAQEINPEFSDTHMQVLQTLGETLNYSGYGDTEADLVSHPLETFTDMSKYKSPFEYVNRSKLYRKIKSQFDKDQQSLSESHVVLEHKCGYVYLLPEGACSARFSGIYSNKLVNDNPDKAFVILTIKRDGFKASIRSPLNNPHGADALAERFETGGGRAKAAGINFLSTDDLDKLKSEFVSVFG